MKPSEKPSAVQHGFGGYANWWAYVAAMKDRYSEEYLAGDLEGYRRGYEDRGQEKKQETTDLTLAGAIYIGIIAAALGFLVGFNLATM